MSQITRCPACATSFKVVADQLRISQGWVRCGQCKEVFDAAAYLLPAPPPALLPDVSLIDVRPPPVAVARNAEVAWAWDSQFQDAPVSGAGSSEPTVEPPRPQDRTPHINLAQSLGADEPILDIPAPTVPAFLAAGGAAAAHDPPAPFVWHTRRSPVPASASAINAFSTSDELPDDDAWGTGVPLAKEDPASNPELSAPSIDEAEVAQVGLDGQSAADSDAPFALSPAHEAIVAEADSWLAQRGYPPLDIPESASTAVAPRDEDAVEALAPSPQLLPDSVPPIEPASDKSSLDGANLALVEDDSEAAVLRVVLAKSTATDREIGDEEVIAEPAHEASFVVAARRRAFWRKPAVRGVLVLVLLLSVLGLAMQMAVQERDRIAAMDARMRPGLTALCEVLRCQIAAPRQISDVVIDSSSFHKARGDSYQLTLVMNNRGTTAVAMPAVELTLTDAQDQPVLRRVLLPNDMVAPAEIAARGEWTTSVSVIVTTGGARVAGYRLLAFYP